VSRSATTVADSLAPDPAAIATAFAATGAIVNRETAKSIRIGMLARRDGGSVSPARRHAGNTIAAISPGALSLNSRRPPCNLATASINDRPSPAPGVLRALSSRPKRRSA